MLTGVDDRVTAIREAAAQRRDHGRHLHEVRARPDDVDDPH
jgi:hypothetical protein